MRDIPIIHSFRIAPPQVIVAAFMGRQHGMVSPYLRRPLRTLDEILAREAERDAAAAACTARLQRAELGVQRDSRVERDGIDRARCEQLAASGR